MKQESPLKQIDLSSLADTPAVRIKELAFMDYLILRADSANQPLQESIKAALGGELPLEPNTKRSAAANEILWYGPSEWLLITPKGHSAQLVGDLRSAFTGMHASATEITGGYTMLEISGLAARDLLVKGTPMDLHSSVFKPGMCAQTAFAKTAATIYLLDDGQTFRVIVRRSYADYVGVWLLDASKEFLLD